MDITLAKVNEYFISNHIWLNEDWLKAVVQYLRQQNVIFLIILTITHFSFQVLPYRLHQAVFHQLIYSDISQSANASFQWPTNNVKELTGHFLFQVWSLLL